MKGGGWELSPPINAVKGQVFASSRFCRMPSAYLFTILIGIRTNSSTMITPDQLSTHASPSQCPSSGTKIFSGVPEVKDALSW